MIYNHMNDSPQVENLMRPDVAHNKNNFTSLPDMDRPGKKNGSTPLGEKMTNLQDQKSPEDDFMMKIFQKSLEDQQKLKEKNINPPVQELVEKNIEPKKPITTDTPKNNPVIQQGFLMPLVDGFNNAIDGIWNALKSLVPMKPQTGAS